LDYLTAFAAQQFSCRSLEFVIPTRAAPQLARICNPNSRSSLGFAIRVFLQIIKFDTNTIISVTQIIVELQDILQALGLQIRASAFKAKTIASALFFCLSKFYFKPLVVDYLAALGDPPN
jgi:hypothetical protein